MPFIRTLFDSVRRPEFEMGGIVGEPLEQLLEMQFRAQRAHYANAYPERDDWIVVADGQDVGNWLVAELPSELRLIDVTLVNHERGKGIGTHLLKSLVEQADRSSKPVVLHVEMRNPAQNLYRRFGFVEEDQVGVYWRMTRQPEIG